MNSRGKAFFLIFTIILSFLLTIQASLAFNYRVEPISNRIGYDEAAIFKLTVINNLKYDDYFTISTRDVNWILSSEPASGFVSAENESAFIIKLLPKPNIPGNNVYIVPVKIKSEETQTYFEEGRKFSILLGGEDQVYVPTVTPTIYVDKVVDPREPVSIRVNLKNRNARELKDIEVSLQGGPGLDKSYSTNILSLEEKVNEVLFRIDPFTAPGKRQMTLTLTFENVTISESSAEFEILGYTDMQERSTKAKSLFREQNSFEIYNNGNQKGTAEHKFSAGFLQRVFTKFDPEVTKEKDSSGLTYYVVRKEIAPKEAFRFNATTDYRLLVTIILLIIISTILYFVFRSPVIIYKSADSIGKPTAEGLSEIKVRLYLKNRSGKAVTNIRITDTVPSIADIKKSVHVGSMDPVNVSKAKKGTLARWEFANLEPYEERVIAYKIESKLKLVGGIRLPSAKTRFEVKPGSERVTYSNSVNLIHNFDMNKE